MKDTIIEILIALGTMGASMALGIILLLLFTNCSIA